jgi:hypothetical protein
MKTKEPIAPILDRVTKRLNRNLASLYSHAGLDIPGHLLPDAVEHGGSLPVGDR